MTRSISSQILPTIVGSQYMPRYTPSHCSNNFHGQEMRSRYLNVQSQLTYEAAHLKILRFRQFPNVVDILKDDIDDPNRQKGLKRRKFYFLKRVASRYRLALRPMTSDDRHDTAYMKFRSKEGRHT